MYDSDMIYVLMFHTKKNPKQMRFVCLTHRGYDAAVEKLRKAIVEEPIIDARHSEYVI